MRRRVLAAALCVVLSACAFQAGPRAESPSAPCNSGVDERLTDGRTLLQAYDSLYALAPTTKQEKLILTPYTSRPRLSNPRVVEQLFSTLYSPAFRMTGVGGSATVAFLVGTDDKTDQVRLLRRSGDAKMDEAAMTIVRNMQFTPAKQRSCPVPFFSATPIAWRVGS